MISSSGIALKAAGFEPVSNGVAKKDCRCVMCGTPIKKGEPIAKWEPTATFTNYTHLAAPESDCLCPNCAGADRSEFKMAWATGAVFNQEGVHKANSIETMAHVILNPPAVPFLWCYGDQKQQHLVWRTPVTLNADLIMIRIGEKVVSIRRQHVLNAKKMVKEIEAHLSTLGKDEQFGGENKAIGSGKNPGNEFNLFDYLDWKLDSHRHGSLNAKLLARAESDKPDAPLFKKLVRCLQSLNFGEMWALMIILKSKEPVKPEIVAKPVGK